MKSRRREARELAMKILFQVEVGHRPLEEVLETTLEAVPVPEEERGFLEDVVHGVLERQTELDQVISELASGWKLERIANIDRNVLRIALYEIQHRSDIPPGVSVNEAVEMAKKYSTADSGKFVNGILGSYLRSHTPSAPPPADVVDPSSSVDEAAA
jgi:transcription antitermination protein NusB